MVPTYNNMLLESVDYARKPSLWRSSVAIRRGDPTHEGDPIPQISQPHLVDLCRGLLCKPLHRTPSEGNQLKGVVARKPSALCDQTE